LKILQQKYLGFVLYNLEIPDIVTENPGINGGSQRQYTVLNIYADAFQFTLKRLEGGIIATHSIWSRGEYGESYWKEIPDMPPHWWKRVNVGEPY